MEKGYGLGDIHEELMKALDCLDKLCKDNEIFYSLHGGALLGAKRNGHLIPWDDDLDVSMTRRNYEKFRKICLTYEGEYYLNEIDTWLPRFATVDRSKPAVFIDIFIWDYISENKLSQFLKINLLRMLQGMLKRNIDYDSYNLKGKILVWSTSAMGKLFSRDFKLKLFKKVETSFLIGRTKYIHRSNDAYKGVSYIFDSNYMSRYSTMELEGKMYMVTSRYEEFLVRNYGSNYMIPPPENERKPLHSTQREMFLHQ